MCINVNNVHGNGDMVMLNTIETAVRGAREIEGIAPDECGDRGRFADEMIQMTSCESRKVGTFRRPRM